MPEVKSPIVARNQNQDFIWWKAQSPRKDESKKLKPCFISNVKTNSMRYTKR